MRNILKCKRGETIVESLVSILIAAVAVAGFCTMVLITARTNARVRSVNREYYQSLAGINAPASAKTVTFQFVDGSGTELASQSQSVTAATYNGVAEYKPTVH